MKAYQRIRTVKIKNILPNPYQIRRKFEQNALSELAQSIKNNGILSPVILRSAKSGYELIAGQRRVRAAVMAGLDEVPAIILSVGDAQCAEISMAENLHRKNLTLFEEAEGYYNLMSYHRVKKDKLQAAVSKKGDEINEKVRLLSLGEDVRYKIDEFNISKECALELLKLHDEKRQLELIEKTVNGDITYRQLRDTVRKETRFNASARRDEHVRNKYNYENRMPLYKNTINRTVDLLKSSGAKVSLSEINSEDFCEFVLKIKKIR